MKDKILLCVDTSGTTLTVSVMKNEAVLSSFNENTGLTHSCTLMPKIIEMIEKADINPEDIDYFVCANGPGSFTGLRIGVSAMKGLSNVLKKPMVEVSVLDGLKENIKDFDGIICPIIDARRKEVYTALYYKNNKITKELNISLDELFVILKKEEKPVIFNGDGVISYKDYIKENIGDKCFFCNDEDMLQNAESIGKVALEKIKKGEITDYKNFSVSYLKPSQPEMEKGNCKKGDCDKMN